jgi:hypothetical protein
MSEHLVLPCQNSLRFLGGFDETPACWACPKRLTSRRLPWTTLHLTMQYCNGSNTSMARREQSVMKAPTSRSPDRSLRQMLRQALSVETATFSSTASSPSKKSTALLSPSVHTTVSELTYACGQGRPAPVDIWHPDFWKMVDDSIVDVEHAGATESAVDDTDEASEIISLPSCLADTEDGSETSVNDDESVLSDISDPDDVKRALYLQAQQLLHPHSVDCGARRGSMVGSVVGNVVSSRSSCMSKSSRRSRRSKSRCVSFSNVHARQYERILDDNPACRFGVSIAIGWEYNEEKVETVDEWEGSRSQRRVRSKSELILSRTKREKLVRSLGCADRDIAAAMREINRVKCHRRQTVNNLKLQHLEETVESAKLRIKSALRPSRTIKSL